MNKGPWDCPECGRTGNTGQYCGNCAHPAPQIDGAESGTGDHSGKYTVGDVITFGQYEQDHNESNGKEDIEWIVLEVESDRILLITKYAIDAKEYHKSSTDSSVTWEICSLRKWLNEDFINTAFSEEERLLIVDSDLHMDNNPQFDTLGGNDTTDKVC